MNNTLHILFVATNLLVQMQTVAPVLLFLNYFSWPLVIMTFRVTYQYFWQFLQ